MVFSHLTPISSSSTLFARSCVRKKRKNQTTRPPQSGFFIGEFHATNHDHRRRRWHDDCRDERGWRAVPMPERRGVHAVRWHDPQGRIGRRPTRASHRRAGGLWPDVAARSPKASTPTWPDGLTKGANHATVFQPRVSQHHARRRQPHENRRSHWRWRQSDPRRWPNPWQGVRSHAWHRHHAARLQRRYGQGPRWFQQRHHPWENLNEARPLCQHRGQAQAHRRR